MTEPMIKTEHFRWMIFEVGEITGVREDAPEEVKKEFENYKKGHPYLSEDGLYIK